MTEKANPLDLNKLKEKQKILFEEMKENVKNVEKSMTFEDYEKLKENFEEYKNITTLCIVEKTLRS